MAATGCGGDLRTWCSHRTNINALSGCRVDKGLFLQSRGCSKGALQQVQVQVQVYVYVRRGGKQYHAYWSSRAAVFIRMWTEERKEGRKEERERRPKKTIRAGAVERWKKEMGELGKRKVIAVVGEGRRREKKMSWKKKEVRKEKRKKKTTFFFTSLFLLFHVVPSSS